MQVHRVHDNNNGRLFLSNLIYILDKEYDIHSHLSFVNLTEHNIFLTFNFKLF